MMICNSCGRERCWDGCPEDPRSYEREESELSDEEVSMTDINIISVLYEDDDLPF